MLGKPKSHGVLIECYRINYNIQFLILKVYIYNSLIFRRKWANALFKKTIQHFAPLSKLISEKEACDLHMTGMPRVSINGDSWVSRLYRG